MSSSQTPDEVIAPQRGGSGDPVTAGVLCYLLSSGLVFLGVLFGYDFLPLARHHQAERGPLLDCFSNWDGRWYLGIVNRGYSYDPIRPSSVAFFPAYPLMGRFMVWATGVPPAVALPLVANLCLAGALVVAASYFRSRLRSAPPLASAYTMLAACLFPPTFFFHMSYTESLFLLLTVGFLLGTERRWPPAVLAALAGLATATRSTGVALVPALTMHLISLRSPPRQALLRLLALLPLSCWGLLAYAIYLGVTFGDPMAFARTQVQWHNRPPAPLLDKAEALLALEPLWSTFDPSSSAYWRSRDPTASPLFSLHAANPTYFALGAALVLFGAVKGWLNRVEVVLAIGLLGIPYLMSSYEMYMAGTARFVSVVVPIYIVMGNLLARANALAATAVLCFSALFLGLYAALFAAWYRFI